MPRAIRATSAGTSRSSSWVVRVRCWPASARWSTRRMKRSCRPSRPTCRAEGISVAVIETMTFRLRDGADEAGFRAADQRLQTEFAYQQPGLLRRTTATGDDGWIVVDLWG